VAGAILATAAAIASAAPALEVTWWLPRLMQTGRPVPQVFIEDPAMAGRYNLAAQMKDRPTGEHHVAQAEASLEAFLSEFKAHWYARWLVYCRR
jgi:hypothetical protein